MSGGDGVVVVPGFTTELPELTRPKLRVACSRKEPYSLFLDQITKNTSLAKLSAPVIKALVMGHQVTHLGEFSGEPENIGSITTIIPSEATK